MKEKTGFLLLKLNILGRLLLIKYDPAHQQWTPR
jgi:hypothetical protein